MPISPALRELLTESIGAVLSENKDIQDVVEKATGNDPYNVYTNKDFPRAKQISEILAHLEKTGTERWLLTHILVRAAGNDRLRQLIVKACPETMDTSVPMDQQVDSFIKEFEQALAIPLEREIKIELRGKRSDFGTLLQHNAELLFYKNLQELLLRLHTKLTVGLTVDPLPDQFKESCNQVLDACREARDGATLLGVDFEGKTLELQSIAGLERLAGQANSEIDAGNTTAAVATLVKIQRLIRVHLSQLNGRVFELAKQLSLRVLIDRPPILLLESFRPLTHAVRDLTPTVLARVLLRKIWQEAFNEMSLVSDLLDAGLTADADFAEHWYTLKSRIRWLTTLEPDAPWSKRLNDYSADIDTQLADEKSDGGIKPSFESYRRAVALGFSAILLKLDFGSLGRINPKLKAVLEEISDV